MSNWKKPATEVSDIKSIGRDAKNKADRILARDWCLKNRWKGVDIGKLERIDTATWHGWRMWKWSKG